jgi:hypothetical protein
MVKEFETEKVASRYTTCKLLSCGTGFVPSRADQKFCSPECRSTYNNNRRIMTEPASPRGTKKNYDMICHYSGTRFASNRKTARFASPIYKSAFNRQRRDLTLVTINQNFIAGELENVFDFINEIFIDCDFDTIDFNHKDFTNARFVRCYFKDCNFSWSLFENVTLDQCDFYGDNIFDDAKVTLTKFPPTPGISIKNAMGKREGTVTQLKQYYNDKVDHKMENLDEYY